MFYAFRWIDWNREKIDGNATEEECEHVVENAGPPYPAPHGKRKWSVWGETAGGRWLQIVYLIDDDGETIFVIHARRLEPAEAKKARSNLKRGKRK